MQLKDLKQGEYFTLKPIEEPNGSQVWIRGEYDRSDGMYLCLRWSDMNTWRYFHGSREVYTDFTF